MNLPWLPVVWIDVIGALATLVLSVLCLHCARRWTQQRQDDTFCYYVLLVTLSFVIFAVSRSVGHVIKQALLFNDMGHLWHEVSPVSGAINTVTFIGIFAFSIYFHRSRKLYLELEGHKNHLEEMVATRTHELADANVSLKKALEEIKTLSGIIPICAHCKKIRDDTGYWNQLEVYIHSHTDANFSHGICPDCAKKFYPEYYDGPEK